MSKLKFNEWNFQISIERNLGGRRRLTFCLQGRLKPCHQVSLPPRFGQPSFCESFLKLFDFHITCWWLGGDGLLLVLPLRLQLVNGRGWDPLLRLGGLGRLDDLEDISSIESLFLNLSGLKKVSINWFNPQQHLPAKGCLLPGEFPHGQPEVAEFLRLVPEGGDHLPEAGLHLAHLPPLLGSLSWKLVAAKHCKFSTIITETSFNWEKWRQMLPPDDWWWPCSLLLCWHSLCWGYSGIAGWRARLIPGLSSPPGPSVVQ